MLDVSLWIRSHNTNTRRAERSYVNKGELVDAIASDANISKTDAEGALNAFINAVQSAITAGEKVAGASGSIAA